MKHALLELHGPWATVVALLSLYLLVLLFLQAVNIRVCLLLMPILPRYRWAIVLESK